jgi:mono/diheme cytochrome c family protein
MSIRRISLVVALVAAASGFARVMGGWAVTTVEDLPDHLVAGEAVELAYVVRQHGVERLSGLTGRVVAQNGRQEIEAPAVARGARGRYVSSLRLPRAGRWTITIHNGFGAAPRPITLMPIQVLAKGAKVAALSEQERGKRLFVAKGCVGCHTHAGVEPRPVAEIGPILTQKRFPADYLARFLANPAATRGGESKMPSLELKDGEIASLVAFINAERAVTVR